MRLVAVLLVLMFATPPIAASARTSAFPPAAACSMAGHSADHLAVCIQGHRMSREARNCLIYSGITTAGVLLGGIIGGAAARAIAGGIVGSGASACLAAIIRA